MNRIILWLGACILTAGMTGCGIFRGSTARNAISTNDSLKAIMASASLTDSAKIALANSLLNARSAGRPADTGLMSAIPPVAADTTAGQPDRTALLAGLLPVWDSRMAYNTFSGKAKVHYEGKGDKQDFTATIRMEKDRQIWISIVALGVFEAARARITPDSIVVLDRLHKEVRMVAFRDAGKLLPVNVDFATLQSLLVGEALHVGQDRPTEAARLADGLMLAVSKEQYEQQLAYNGADTSIRQQQLKVRGDKGALINLRYSDYERVDGRLFANGRIIDIQDTSGNYHVELQFGSAGFDEQLDFSFSVPAKYTRK